MGYYTGKNFHFPGIWIPLTYPRTGKEWKTETMNSYLLSQARTNSLPSIIIELNSVPGTGNMLVRRAGKDPNLLEIKF